MKTGYLAGRTTRRAYRLPTSLPSKVVLGPPGRRLLPARSIRGSSPSAAIAIFHDEGIELQELAAVQAQ